MVITKTSPFTKKEIEKLRIAIESLSMDLLRIALFYHKKSISMAKRFSIEALKRQKEIDEKQVEPYFARVLEEIHHILISSKSEAIAEDALMYSVLCRNYAKKFLTD